MNYLDLDDLLHIAERTVGAVELRDVGLLESAVNRPQVTVLGADAYPTLTEKAAALVHAIARNHALVDGNKRLALAGLVTFLGINGWRLIYTNDEAYDFIMAIAAGELSDVVEIARRLDPAIEPATF